MQSSYVLLTKVLCCMHRRKDNLKGRVDAKMQKKKDKREKKLMRPGFEGRRTAMLGKSTP